jgi:alkanesulfonate monooxygenase SsuD/methylene tetrahydromethanopterin reductase-like flavin-dependent oxidoreductase (luciferase family)
MDREGVDGPGGIAIVGTHDEVRDQVRAIADLGVTDFGVGVFAGNPDEEAATIAAVREAVA